MSEPATVSRKASESIVIDALALQSFDNGDFEQAEILQRGALEETSQAFGADHPLATNIMHNLAATLLVLEQHDEALELEHEVVRRHEMILGPYHPATLAARSALSRIMTMADQMDESIEVDDDVLKKRRDTGAFRKVLEHLASSAWYQPHNVHKTLAVQEVVASARQRVLGKEHPQTLLAVATLVATLTHCGDLEAAIKHQREIRDLQQESFHLDELDELSPSEILAFLLREDGRLVDVLSLRREMFEQCKAENGEDHHTTLVTMSKLGAALWENGVSDEAVATQSAVWEMGREQNGDEHEESIDALEDLAFMLYCQQQTDAAISHQQKVVAWRREHMQLLDYKAVRSGETLAFRLFEQGQFDAAVSEFQTPVKTIGH
ncbi:hypothetical protein AYL99_05502 [Fonsecaea erecta]|uniref:MalT-like TPR region domain-containing protein n=1 Tax=Fonsecaea erecta TaxID=1367422 RepID=A0A178ZL32_9EURO|nr:hypothetical protein AYL99_05502 [Fonsecaea erecta]OAP60500.1 hypothetical protein AYL99_05502 [Fonsecaea erecta]